VSYTDDDPPRRRRDDYDDDDYPRRRRDDDYDDDYRDRPVANIPNYLVQSILCLICCCWPAAIVAIVYAAQVNGKLNAGDVRGAQSASDTAKMWCWISFGLGLVANSIAAVYYFYIFNQMAGMNGGGGF
jgi:hypothetical protein